MNVGKWMLFTMLGILLAGCSSMQIQSDFDPEADFTGYKMWDWLAGGPDDTGDRRLDNPRVRERIENAIDGEFRARGYERTSGATDFFVKYHVGIGEELNTRNIENYYEYLNYQVFAPRVTASYTDVWETGTLIIDVLDAEEKRLVWRGIARMEINPQAGPKENEPKIKKAVSKMLDRFPPE